MAGKYVLDGYDYKNADDYMAALEELKMIKRIKERCDVNDPEMAKALLIKIDEGAIALNTPIGDKFYRYLSKKSQRLVSEESIFDKSFQEVLKEEREGEEVKKLKLSPKKIYIFVIIVVFIIAAIVAGVMIYSKLNQPVPSEITIETV